MGSRETPEQQTMKINSTINKIKITQSTPKLCTLSSDLFIKESQFCQLLLMASPQEVGPGDQVSHLAPCLRFSLLSQPVRIPSQTLRYLLYASPLHLQLLKTVLCLLPLESLVFCLTVLSFGLKMGTIPCPCSCYTCQ